jgi:hypothetical protein
LMDVLDVYYTLVNRGKGVNGRGYSYTEAR